MTSTRPLTLLLAALTLWGCAYNATGTPPRSTLIIEIGVEGSSLYQGNNLAYYLVLNAQPDKPRPNSKGVMVNPPDATGNNERAPLVNGPAPLSYPYPDPRSYLPFTRDQEAFLDRQPVTVPNTYWTDYFALYEDAGQYVMWQGRQRDDGTVNERYRQLQQGREFGITNNKLQITVPFDQLAFTNPDAPPAEIPANVAVALRNITPPPNASIYNGPPLGVIDRWLGTVQNQWFRLQTRQINQNLYDTISGVTFPANLPAGVPPASVNVQTITYRVIRGDQQ